MSTKEIPTPADVAEKVDAAPKREEQASEGTAQDSTDWKAEARKWEQRAKENRQAAERLAELEQAQMSEQEKVEARVKAAEDRAAELEVRNRVAEVALEYGLSADDAALLNGVSDVESMRQIAKRLAAKAEADAGPRAPRPNPAQQQGDAIPDDADAAARAFFGFD